jgi:nitrate reductase gamma subunit
LQIRASEIVRLSSGYIVDSTPPGKKVKSDDMWLQIITYLCILLFFIVSILKARRYAKYPLHLRWELYPVAHEEHRTYGGSYMQEPEWWTRSRRKTLTGEITFMIREIFLFRECFLRSRGLWLVSYPLHLGIYLLAMWYFLLICGTVLNLTGVPVTVDSPAVLGIIIHLVIVIIGVSSFVLGTFGSIGLLVRRLTSEGLRIYSSIVDYFNLLFLAAVFGSGLFAWYLHDRGLNVMRGFVGDLITFNKLTGINPATAIHISLTALFIAYLPFTRMIHFFAKYFTFHSVRWDDEPNTRGSHLEKQLENLFEQPIMWSAPHIENKKWSQLASRRQARSGSEANH